MKKWMPLLALAAMGCSETKVNKDTAKTCQPPFDSKSALDLAYVNDEPAADSLTRFRWQDPITQRALFASLVGLNHQGEPQLALAKHITASEDLQTITIELKEGLVWSSGQPLLAQDMVQGWQSHFQRFQTSGFVDIGLKVEQGRLAIEAQDDHHLTLQFNQPTPEYLYVLTADVLTVVDAQFNRFSQQQQYELCEGRVYVQSQGHQLIVSTYESDQQLNEAIKAGRVDLAYTHSGKTKDIPMNSLGYFLVNRSVPKLSSPYLSQALGRPLVLSDDYLAITGIYSGYNSLDRITDSYSTLLAMAGYNADNPLNFTITHNDYGSTNAFVAEMQSQWQQSAGIGMVDHRAIASEDYDAILHSTNFEVLRQGWRFDYQHPLDIYRHIVHSHAHTWPDDFRSLIETKLALLTPESVALDSLGLKEIDWLLISEGGVIPVYQYTWPYYLHPTIHLPEHLEGRPIEWLNWWDLTISG